MEGQSHMTPSTPYVSFLIRMWREPSPEWSDELSADWHSEVEHIQSGQRWTFSTLDELLDFLRRWVEDSNVLWPSASK